MNLDTFHMLEFDKIKQQLKSYIQSDMGSLLIDNLEPSKNIDVIRVWKMETTEGRVLIDNFFNLPVFYSINGMYSVLDKVSKEITLRADEFKNIIEFLNAMEELKLFLMQKKYYAPLISSYSRSINDIDVLEDEIKKCIKNDRIIDNASSNLFRIRKQIKELRVQIKEKLEYILKGAEVSKYLQGSVSIKNGRYVIPVKRSFRKNIEGDVLDISDSGATAFVEPKAIKKLHEEVMSLESEQKNEELKILGYLTELVKNLDRKLKVNLEIMTHFDFIFAKAKYSQFINGNSVKLTTEKYIEIIDGVHPLLENKPIPLNMKIGRGYKTLIITGPNTGGKTVAIKTLGLLTLMVQCGLHVPAAKDSTFAVFENIFTDIGDGQNIEESLSTFSSHIKNIIYITKNSDEKSLILLDELGAGTDPDEGMALAISVLLELYKKNSIVLATTHHSEIKAFAAKTSGFENGCMEFDEDTLKPLYSLSIGKMGRSNAFSIALKLGMDKDLVDRAVKISSEKIYSKDSYSKSDSKHTNRNNQNDVKTKNKDKAIKNNFRKNVRKEEKR